MKSSIIDSIKSLPPLPKTIVEMQRVTNDPDAAIADLTKVVEQDPMIVANLLKAANSPLYSFGREIKNVAQAVSLFGMSMTRSIALGNSVRKLLNVDMEPYGITSEKFAEYSAMQATLAYNWIKKLDREMADKLFLAAFLQETGKILIASDIITDDLTTSFKSEIEMSSNIAQVEFSFVEDTTASVTAAIFEHWKFDEEFVEMLRFSDSFERAPEEIADYAAVLNIVKTIIPVNAPLSEQSINIGLQKAADAGFEHEALEDEVDAMLEKTQLV